jgi:hypothetical protein
MTICYSHPDGRSSLNNPPKNPKPAKLELSCFPTKTRNTMTNAALEQRLAAIETAIAQLQQHLATPQPTNWLQQITGSFKDEPAFDEILNYGQAIRQGDESLLDDEYES